MSFSGAIGVIGVVFGASTLSDTLGLSLSEATDVDLSGVTGAAGVTAVEVFAFPCLDSGVSVEAFLLLSTVGVTIVVEIERSTSLANTGFAPKADNNTAVDAKKNLLFFILNILSIF